MYQIDQHLVAAEYLYPDINLSGDMAFNRSPKGFRNDIWQPFNNFTSWNQKNQDCRDRETSCPENQVVWSHEKWLVTLLGVSVLKTKPTTKSYKLP